MKTKETSALRRRAGVLPIDSYSLMGDPAPAPLPPAKRPMIAKFCSREHIGMYHYHGPPKKPGKSRK